MEVFRRHLHIQWEEWCSISQHICCSKIVPCSFVQDFYLTCRITLPVPLIDTLDEHSMTGLLALQLSNTLSTVLYTCGAILATLKGQEVSCVYLAICLVLQCKCVWECLPQTDRSQIVQETRTAGVFIITRAHKTQGIQGKPVELHL